MALTTNLENLGKSYEVEYIRRAARRLMSAETTVTLHSKTHLIASERVSLRGVCQFFCNDATKGRIERICYILNGYDKIISYSLAISQ